MLNKELTALQEELNYHRNSIQELEERIAEVKVYDGYAAQATEAVEDAIEQIGMGKYLWLFKEHILSMFPEQPPAYLEDKVEKEISIVVPQALANQESKQEAKEVKPEKSYYELTGRPDLSPTAYEDLAPNVSYSSDGRAYVGFNDKDEAEEFRDAISEPSLLDDTVIMNGFKFEVKFHCSKQYIQEIADSINSMSDDPVDNFEEINSRVIYNHNDKTVYLGMTAKNRCDYYGQYLTGQLTVGEKYTCSNKPSFINGEEYKYELRITKIELNDAVHLASFNLQRDPEHPDNAKLLTDWRANKVRQYPPAYTPSPKAIALEDVKLGDIVTTDATKVKDKQYKVLAHKELESVPHVEAICIFNKEMPALVNNCSWFKEVYPVEPRDVRIAPQFLQETAPQFCNREREEVLTEDVQIYAPKENPAIKKSQILSENNFPSYPYTEIPLTEVEFGDVITSTPHSRSAYMVKEHKGEFVLAECLYHKSLPSRVGGEYSFSKIYLVEKADAKVAM